MPNSDRGLAPNPVQREASLIEDLTEGQKKAASHAWSLLLHMASAEYTTSSATSARNWESVLPQIYGEKNNQVVLIDGRRGSGKTTTLLNLLDYIKRRFLSGCNNASITLDKTQIPDYYTRAEDEVRMRIADAKQKDAKNADAKQKNTKDIFLNSHIIPIGLIHLGPIPHDANLFVYLATQFRLVINMLEEDGYGGGYPSSRAELASTAQWKDFMSIAGTAWEGNLQERRANLDADAYALELEQTEGRRVYFRESFHKLIDALCQDAGQKLSNGRANPKSPLWVIPIDDADMNPAQSKNLLFLLRTLWHPRVAYLLTGDKSLFRQLLRSHVLAELTEPLRGYAIFGDRYDSAEIIKQSRKLAQDIYDKVLPPSHHCHIPDLGSNDRYELIRNYVATVKFTLDPELPILNDKDKEEIEINRIFEALAASTYALPGRIRTMWNLINEVRLYKIREEVGDQRWSLREFIKERWRYFVEKDLEPKSRKRYGDIFIQSPNNELSVNHRDQFDIRLLWIDTPQGIPGTDVSLGEYTGFTGYFLERNSNKKSKNSNTGEPLRKMSEDLLATLLLAISAFPFTRLFDARPAAYVDDWRGKLTSDSMNPAFVRAWHDPWKIDNGNATLFKSARDLIWLGFPIPDWESPFTWMILNRLWKRYRNGRKDYKDIVCAFFWSVIRTHDTKGNTLSRGTIDQMVQELPELPKLNDVLKGVQGHAVDRRGLRSQRTWDLANWAAGLAALVAAPESGCSGTDAEDILKGLLPSEGKDKPEAIALIQRSRRLRVECALRNAGLKEDKLKEAAELFINHVDSQHGGHAWLRLIEQGRAKGTLGT